MGKIKPTFNLTANASSATTDPGPLTVALTLSATDSLDVTAVQTKIVSPTTTHAVLWDHTAFSDGTETAGTDGGFVYVKNLHATVNVAIGFGSSGALQADDTALRLMTLKPGEFGWFPWDFTADIIVDSITSTATDGLESWVFTRTQ
jgi:hypothetical protein|tara:strand:+ start:716 stop:1156 length:441 start_codon:yes stop_codon:yes gene_type:complete